MTEPFYTSQNVIVYVYQQSMHFPAPLSSSDSCPAINVRIPSGVNPSLPPSLPRGDNFDLISSPLTIIA